MSNKFISYKTQCYLALIPYIGLLIAWITSWINIYLRTRQKKYIFIHYIIWVLPMCLVGGLLAFSTIMLKDNLSFQTYSVCILIIGYVACFIMSFLAIVISKFIIQKYDLKNII